MTDQRDEQTVYELGYLVTPLLPEAGLEEEVAALKKGIEAAGGTIVSEEYPKMRYLAYTITKKIANKNVNFSESYFGWMRFAGAPTVVAAVQEMIKKDDHLVRTLILVAPKDDPKKKGSPAEAEGGEAGEDPKATDQEIDREIDQLIAA